LHSVTPLTKKKKINKNIRTIRTVTYGYTELKVPVMMKDEKGKRQPVPGEFKTIRSKTQRKTITTKEVPRISENKYELLSEIGELNNSDYRTQRTYLIKNKKQILKLKRADCDTIKIAKGKIPASKPYYRYEDTMEAMHHDIKIQQMSELNDPLRLHEFYRKLNDLSLKKEQIFDYKPFMPEKNLVLSVLKVKLKLHNVRFISMRKFGRPSYFDKKKGVIIKGSELDAYDNLEKIERDTRVMREIMMKKKARRR